MNTTRTRMTKNEDLYIIKDKKVAGGNRLPNVLKKVFLNQASKGS